MKKHKIKTFVIFGTYSIVAQVKMDRLAVCSVNLNPQQTFGADFDALPKITIDKDAVKVKWLLRKVKL